MLSKLKAVQRRAQLGHRYIDDQRKHGVPEHWEIALRGDCEDYALWCRQELAKEGIESDLILCLVDGAGHLVCSVDGWILDNRHDRVMRRDDLPYQWLKIGKPDGKWYDIVA